MPGLTVKLTGPASNAAVNPGESARYEITVRNAGTLPSTMVRVIGTLPNDTRPTSKTEGGVLQRDAIQWVVPRLEPGEARTYRFAVKAQSTGRRVVVATVADARGQRAVDELTTLFQGTAALVWETIPNPVALAVGKQGTFTIKVRNNGGEAARNVRVEVDLPEAISVVQVTPNIRPHAAPSSLSRLRPSRPTVKRSTQSPTRPSPPRRPGSNCDFRPMLSATSRCKPRRRSKSPAGGSSEGRDHLPK